MLNFSRLTDAERHELTSLIDAVASSQVAFGGDVFAFEHGSIHHGSVMGCGVDQAHLHLVPLDFDLVAAVKSSDGSDLDWKHYSRILLTDLPPEREYIALWQVGSGRGALATVQNPVSQWMRRFIAQKIGVQRDWNYRSNPQLENIQTTVDTLRRMGSSTM